MSEQSLIRDIRAFSDERNWDRFHSPENLSKSISIESAELLECFQWGTDPNWDDVRDELADVLTYAYLLADKLGLEPENIVRSKMRKTAEKYPAADAHCGAKTHSAPLNVRAEN